MLRPMRALVTLRHPDGTEHELGHGDLIGRLWSARLQLASPDISEAHALVSLRGGELHLLALRGLFAHKGKPCKSLVLAPGQQIHFSRELALEVVDVVLPDETLGIEGPGIPRQALAGVASLVTAPQVALRPGVVRDAAAVFFTVDDGWRVRTAEGTAPLAPGWCLPVPGGPVRAVLVSLSRAGQRPTLAVGRLDAALRLETHFDLVHIHREGAPTVSLRGHAARLITELAQAGTALPWEELALALWKDPAHRDQLRRRFDAVLSRTRRRLSQEGLRANLLGADGAGNLFLLLRPGDEVDDRS